MRRTDDGDRHHVTFGGDKKLLGLDVPRIPYAISVAFMFGSSLKSDNFCRKKYLLMAFALNKSANRVINTDVTLAIEKVDASFVISTELVITGWPNKCRRRIRKKLMGGK